MSGLMYLRQVSEDIWRVALSAKIGQTLFDFELRPDTFIIHRCIDQLRRKIVLSYLEEDLRLLTERYPEPLQLARLPAPQGLDYVRFKASGMNGWRHLTISTDSGIVTEVACGSRRSRKTEVDFSAFLDGLPRVIAIDHRTIFNFDIRMQHVPDSKQQQ
jgi:hypothetical protein